MTGPNCSCSLLPRHTDSVYKLNYHVYSDNALRTQLERPGVLLNRSALVWKATVAAGVAVNLLPTSAGISIYSTGHDTIFNVRLSRCSLSVQPHPNMHSQVELGLFCFPKFGSEDSPWDICFASGGREPIRAHVHLQLPRRSVQELLAPLESGRGPDQPRRREGRRGERHHDQDVHRLQGRH